MAFTRDELLAYEKKPQTKVDDKLNPFKGATPAQAADAAAVAAVAAGQVDATPGGKVAAATPDPLVDDNTPVVDEDGTLGDPTDSGEGTSDVAADPSTASADLSGESVSNTDLTGEQTSEEEPVARPAPKKGSAEERIVELNDLLEGTKVFGRHMQDQLKSALSELERLKGGGTSATTTTAPAIAPPVVEQDEPMPSLSDPDVVFDDDKYRAKMHKWSKAQARIAAREAVRELTGADASRRLEEDVATKCATFAKTHPDFEAVVTKNQVLAANQLAPDAGYAVAQSEHTADLLYRFGKDVGFAMRVARQSPAQQLISVGRMIAQIEADKAATKPKQGNGSVQQHGAKPVQKKSITQAPPPPRATPAAGRPTGRDVLDPAMDINEFARQHRESKQSSRAQSRKMRGLD